MRKPQLQAIIFLLLETAFFVFLLSLSGLNPYRVIALNIFGLVFGFQAAIIYVGDYENHHH